MTVDARKLADAIEQYLPAGFARERLSELLILADCGGVNCGKCQQCLTVDKHFALQAVEHLRANAEALAEALERLASQEGFDGAGYIDPASFAWRELALRGEFAAAALAHYRGEK